MGIRSNSISTLSASMDTLVVTSVTGRLYGTASYSDTSSNAITLDGTSSMEFVTVYNIYQLVDTGSFISTGSINQFISGNLEVGGNLTVTGSIVGNLTGTSSYSTYSETSSLATSSSQALTASYVDITGSGIIVNYNGSQIQLTGSNTAALPCYSTYVKYAEGNPSYPTAGNYAGITYNVATQAEFTTALSSAVTGDVINLTADIDLASTLTINKSVKIVGNGFAIQTPATSNTIATAVSVTANDVYFDSTVVIKQRKTNNTSVDVAVAVNALNFVSEATIEFMEFGYVLRGTNVSFNISGTTKYTGALANNHRHIAVYTMTANSVIDGVVFDFPQETTSRASSIALLYSTAGDVKTATLKVANTTQTATYGRQFFLIESLSGITAGGNFALIFDNNTWNDVNGGIGILSNSVSPLNYLRFLQLTNNTQGNAGIASYKGLVFLDGSGTIVPVGNTSIYYENNTHPTTLRVDYTSAIDNGGIAYDNTALTNPLPITTVTDCEIVNNALEYVSSVPTGSGGSGVSSSYATTASFAETASYVATASYALTSSLSETASYAITASHALNIPDTASWAINALTASHFVTESVSSASYAAYALTASYALNGGGGGGTTSIPFSYTLEVTSSLPLNGNWSTVRTFTSGALATLDFNKSIQIEYPYGEFWDNTENYGFVFNQFGLIPALSTVPKPRPLIGLSTPTWKWAPSLRTGTLIEQPINWLHYNFEPSGSNPLYTYNREMRLIKSGSNMLWQMRSINPNSDNSNNITFFPGTFLYIGGTITYLN